MRGGSGRFTLGRSKTPTVLMYKSARSHLQELLNRLDQAPQAKRSSTQLISPLPNRQGSMATSPSCRTGRSVESPRPLDPRGSCDRKCSNFLAGSRGQIDE